MKEKLTLFFLILSFLFVLFWQIIQNNNPRVLKVVSPVLIQVDFNSNNIFDDGELVCVSGVESFTSNLSKFSDNLANDLGLSPDKAIAVGYLADEFANNFLTGKRVKLHFAKEHKSECRSADIFVDGVDYGESLYNAGFGIRSGKSVNESEFKKNLIKAEKLKLVILNHNSNKYHTLTCKYGRIAHDAVVLQLKEIPKNAKPCKFCHLSKSEEKKFTKLKEIVPPPSSITDGSFKLILTDFTTILKPDRTCSHIVCSELVNLIKNSTSTIDIAMYGWANIPKVVEALEDAQRRGVVIRIVYDTTSSNKANYYPETTSFVEKYENIRSDSIEGSSKLTNMLMHNKFFVFDNRKVYTGSMNFSTTGLSGFNHNNVIVINSSKIASLYTAEFNQMFDGKFHTLKALSSDNKEINVGNSEVSVFFSPQDKPLLNAVVPIVNKANKYIYVPTFIITHDDLFDALVAAKKRGVDVRFILDATGVHSTNSKVKILRANNIPVKVENFAGKMHAKAMIIDDEYLILGSANFSKSAENKNDENTLLIRNQKLAKLYADYFRYFWLKIPDKYLKYNVSAESVYSLGSCSDGIDNDFDGKTDFADEGCKK